MESIGRQSIADIDLTELPGLDNLHQPQGIIGEAQAKCAQWLGVKDTFFLVNGASVGIQAAILACTGPGDRILVPRNAHRSLTTALILSGATPIYYLPEIHPDFGLPLGQAPQTVIDKLKSDPKVKLLFTVYPTYFGTTWDLNQVRQKWQGLLAVDEAHGAHFAFFNGFPPSATSLKADIVVQSTHKTLAALTQAAMLHIGQTCPVPSECFLQALDILHTTSPSYVLMASTESAFWDGVDKAKGHWKALAEAALQLKSSLSSKGIRVLDAEDSGKYGIAAVDQTKILLHVPHRRARDLVYKLNRHYGVLPELWDASNVLFIIGAGDKPEGIQDLAKILLAECESCEPQSGFFFPSPPLPEQALTPRGAYFSSKHLISLQESCGRVCGEILSPYPPGVPVIVPGEIISKEIIEYIMCSKNQGIHWQGSADANLEKILVVKD